MWNLCPLAFYPRTMNRILASATLQQKRGIGHYLEASGSSMLCLSYILLLIEHHDQAAYIRKHLTGILV